MDAGDARQKTDRAYSARGTVTDQEFTQVMKRYRTLSDAAIAGLEGHRDIVYDPTSDERLDVWGTEARTLRPVVVAIHGGYWRMLSRHDTAFMAKILNDFGVATVTVDYTLSPSATLEEIVRQVRASITWIHRHGAKHGLDPHRIHVLGSSAGGHLALMTAVGGWQRDVGVPEDIIKAAMPVSGLFDVRPLVDSFVNDWLDLDAERAAAVSPVLKAPGGCPIAVVVAENDPLGFQLQAHALHDRWRSRAISDHILIPSRHHFDVFLELTDPASLLTQTLLRLVATSA